MIDFEKSLSAVFVHYTKRKPLMRMHSGPLSVAIADVFNQAFQSHSDDAPNEEILAEVAEGIAAILAAAGYCTERAFMEGTLLRARAMWLY
jgi:hypothetical protein